MTDMVTQDGAWMGDVNKCPADRDFGYWLEENDVRGKTIFHMGPGGHHTVGKMAARTGNRVLAMTNCVEEMDLYMEYAIEHPRETWCYQVLFGDVHVLNPDMLPQFDIATLFHVGEMPDARRDEYAVHDVAEVISMLAGQMGPQGTLVFYTRSAAWSRVKPLVAIISASSSWAAVESRDLLVVQRRS